MSKASSVIAISALIALLHGAHADPGTRPTCRVLPDSDGSHEFSSFLQVDAKIRLLLAKHFEKSDSAFGYRLSVMKNRYEPWQQDDNSSRSSTIIRRFVRSGTYKGRSYVWYEREAKDGLTSQVVVFDLPPRASSPNLMFHLSANSPTNASDPAKQIDAVCRAVRIFMQVPESASRPDGNLLW